ncbi:hypothetical protein MKQ68_06720 [Chitinophaga horti]|uniref:DUF1795 domain-containing protein n=1 Tax=Chitinophaga horti TaxID=2920382 RepID=A0ABY6J596_9BACT|nr:hypothetical protein [Chitinophaga horti]UYQ94783.1 hypothetical protein MKQ68_06720 [Chitinophaga horti]
MKRLFIIIYLLQAVVTQAQELIIVKDTTDNFSIGLPTGWQFQREPAKGKFFAWQTDTAQPRFSGRCNLSINYVPFPNPTMEQVVTEVVNSIPGRKNGKLVDSGSVFMYGQHMVWLDVTSNNHVTDTPMLSTTYLSTDDNGCYILVGAAPQSYGASSTALFHTIAESFRHGDAVKEERLHLTFPATVNLRQQSYMENTEILRTRWLPNGQTIDNWQLAINVLAWKNSQVDSVEQAIATLNGSVLLQQPSAKFTVLEKSNTPGNIWALLQLENVKPSDGRQIAEVYYIVQGKTNFHVASASLPHKTLPAAFVKEWTTIFKQGQLVLE